MGQPCSLLGKEETDFGSVSGVKDEGESLSQQLARTDLCQSSLSACLRLSAEIAALLVYIFLLVSVPMQLG